MLVPYFFTKTKTWNIQLILGGKGTIKMIGTQTSKLTALLSLAGVGEDTLLAAADPVAANIFLLGISPIIAASIVTSLWLCFLGLGISAAKRAER